MTHKNLSLRVSHLPRRRSLSPIPSHSDLIQEKYRPEPTCASSGIMKPWRRLLQLLSRRVPRCRGCGSTREPASVEGPSLPQADQRARTMSALCVNCRSFVEQMSQDARIMAVFIFRLGKEPKYYAGFQPSTTLGWALLKLLRTQGELKGTDEANPIKHPRPDPGGQLSGLRIR
jgi:hypothetical protein